MLRPDMTMASKLTTGNTAVVVGAVYAGCDGFFGYPITPASDILEKSATVFRRLGRVFVQAESEEAAINMVYGGAAAGHRVMTASSGPGFSLMQECISYLAGAELPAVVVVIMRAGPGLGNIGPEQGDYAQATRGGGHGNYKSIVLAPGGVQEMCDITIRAFDLAFTYRNPVIVLADGVLGQMIEPLEFPAAARTPTPPDQWAVRGTRATRGNLITSIQLDFDQQEAFNCHLQEKYAQIQDAEQDAEEYGVEDADTILVAYGICGRLARTAVDLARAEGRRVGLVRPKTLFPFPTRALARLAEDDARRFVVVELSNGQLRDDVLLATRCRCTVDLVNRMGGALVTLDDILRAVSGN